MVFQDPQSALNPRRPVGRLITQSLEASGSHASEAERVARARALLTETGLPPDLLDRFPSQLSGGQKQRVNIARALCVTPRLLVADEIVSGLDVSVQAQILNLLLSCAKSAASASSSSRTTSRWCVISARACSSCGTERWLRRARPSTSSPIPAHPYTQSLIASVPPEDLDRPWPPEQVGSAA